MYVQCDHIWRKFATLAIFLKSLAIFEGLFNIWQNCELTLATFYAFGQLLNVVNAQI